MVVEPTSPHPMVGPAARDERPELRPVPEHAQVRELVTDDGLERLGGREDQSPGERQPART